MNADRVQGAVMAGAAATATAGQALLRRRLESAGPLRPEDLALLPPLAGERIAHAPGSEIGGGGGAEARLLVAGFAGDCRLLSNGRRQILHIRVPGDVLAIGGRASGDSVIALTRAESVDAGPLVRVLADPTPETRPLRAAWQRLERVDRAALLDQIVRLGRLSALERMAHLLLELHERLLRVGMATADGFHLPLTQEVLADALGLSVVHVNRTLQQLRRDGMLAYRAGRVVFSERERLADIAGYTLQVPTPAGARQRRGRAASSA